jgi:hypothetical protein
MLGRRALHTKAVAAISILGAASIAALLAHVAIDLVGDFVLTHDTYDGLEHRSRSDVCSVAFVLALGAVLRVIWFALNEARTGRPALRPTFEDVFGNSRVRFACAVIAVSLPALMTMEMCDVVADGRHLDDVTDLLGGSAWLGLSIAVAAAAAVAFLVHGVVRLALLSHRALVTIIGRLLAFLGAPSRRAGARPSAHVVDRRPRRRSILSRRFGKRGPPLAAV